MRNKRRVCRPAHDVARGVRRVADEIAAMPTIDSAIDVLLALGRAA